ncbi:MAG: helix-turn-helix domain-containing protein [Candidatus Rokubacteria bacterium]|jgi:excisionase family DNA binding protein|nr:helix-turn-helix domain-containing protein [Candidatus Rokubacteria bacterium]
MAKGKTAGAIRVQANPPAVLQVARATRHGVQLLGPRARLTLDEAAEALGRSRDDVKRAIRAGFLRAVQRGSRCYVTVQACAAFLAEERHDADAAARAEADAAARGELPIPWDRARKRL